MKKTIFGILMPAIIIIAFASCSPKNNSAPGRFTTYFAEDDTSVYWRDTTAMIITVLPIAGKPAASTAQDSADIRYMGWQHVRGYVPKETDPK